MVVGHWYFSPSLRQRHSLPTPKARFGVKVEAKVWHIERDKSTQRYHLPVGL